MKRKGKSKEEIEFEIGKEKLWRREMERSDKNFKKTYPKLYKKAEEKDLSLPEKDKVYRYATEIPKQDMIEVLKKKESTGKPIKNLIKEKKSEKVKEYIESLKEIEKEIEKIKKNAENEEEAEQKIKNLKEIADKIERRAHTLADFEGNRYMVKK